VKTVNIPGAGDLPFEVMTNADQWDVGDYFMYSMNNSIYKCVGKIVRNGETFWKSISYSTYYKKWDALEHTYKKSDWWLDPHSLRILLIKGELQYDPNQQGDTDEDI
jgi:hypothetical protein